MSVSHPGASSAENIGDGSTASHNRVDPKEFRFDAENEAEIGRILAKYPEGQQASAADPVSGAGPDAPRNRQRLGAAGGDGRGGRAPTHAADTRL